MREGPPSGPAGDGLSERGWRLAGLLIWSGVLAAAALGLGLMVLTFNDARLPRLNLPRIGAPELTLPDLGGLRISPSEDAKPGSTRPEGMARGDRAAEARPVEADSSGS